MATWRAFCVHCEWYKLGFADRAGARESGLTHAKTAHPEDEWEIRIQGLRPSASWRVLHDDTEDEPRDIGENSNVAWRIASRVHLLDAVPYSEAPSLDDELFVVLSACELAVDMLYEQVKAKTAGRRG